MVKAFVSPQQKSGAEMLSVSFVLGACQFHFELRCGCRCSNCLFLNNPFIAMLLPTLRRNVKLLWKSCPQTRFKDTPRFMARGDLTERTLTTFFLLLERPHTQAELAAYFGVSARTVTRDITALSGLIPVYDEPLEDDRRQTLYRLVDGFEFRLPQLTALELAVLLLAQESIALTGLTSAQSSFTAAARSLIAKVRATLPAALRAQLDALSAVYGSAATPAKDFAAHANTVAQLTSAAIALRQVELHYEGLTSGESSLRVFEPYAVYFDPDGATLKTIGFDSKRQTIIPLSIDRIQKLVATDAAFARPSDFNLRDYLTFNCFNGIHGAAVDVTLKTYGITARIFAERRFHPSQQTVTQRETKDNVSYDTTTIQMRVAGGRGLLRFILGWLPDIEVVAPDELRAEVAGVIASAAQRFATSVKAEHDALDDTAI